MILVEGGDKMYYKNPGIDNEIEFADSFDNKRFCDLNILQQDFIEDLFGKVKKLSYIRAWKCKYNFKTDIYIKIDDIVKRVSIKKGINNSVHTEPISEFIHFLIENNINQDLINNYLKYHYADGTLNGSGEKRLSGLEYKKDHQTELDEINNAINTKDMLNKILDRFILKGTNSYSQIDVLVYGTKDNFIWLLKDEIIDIIYSKINYYSTGIHFGPLFCQPKDRCLNYNPKYNKYRFLIQIKWYSIFDDYIEYKNTKCMEQAQYIE